jgi:hypothetical protein
MAYLCVRQYRIWAVDATIHQFRPDPFEGWCDQLSRKSIGDKTSDVRADRPATSRTSLFADDAEKSIRAKKTAPNLPQLIDGSAVSRPENRMVRDELYACCDVIGAREAIVNHAVPERKVAF